MRRTIIINPRAIKRTTYEEAKSAFLKHCKLRNLQPQTIRYYEEDIVYFQKQLPVKYIDLITKDVFEDFIMAELDAGEKVSSLNSRMAYDSFGNMTSIAVGTQNLASYIYGANNGNLQSMTYGNGAVVSYAYDNLDRVTHEYWNNSLKYQYFYNAEGNLSKKLDVVTNIAVNYEYDSLGRLIHSYQTNGSAIELQTEHVYDTENRIKNQSWKSGTASYIEGHSYDEEDGSLTSMTVGTGQSAVIGLFYAYDSLKRLSSVTGDSHIQTYSYRGIGDSQTTTQVSSIAYSKSHLSGNTNSSLLSEFTLNYDYDNLGNIKTVTGTNNALQNASYTYDQQGQLLTETNNKGSYTYSYDTYGNIRSVSGAESHTYTYADDKGWYDLLTAYDGHTINYDAIGNPTNWYNTKDWTFTWQNGRQLASASDGTTSISYTYDVAGIRDSKTVTTSDGSITYNYLTLNGQVVSQTWTEDNTNHYLYFFYDANGRPIAVNYDGIMHYYVLNLQGDVIRIVGFYGNEVASYVYDAWGNVISSSGTLADVNPIHYRGYYYDTETGLYYLQSRYYDPTVKRFVNADGYASTGQGFVGYNMYVYCNNSPVAMYDLRGTNPGFALPFVELVKLVVGAVIICVAANGAACTIQDSMQSIGKIWPKNAFGNDSPPNVGQDTLDLPSIASQYGKYKCVEATEAMALELEKRKEDAKIIELSFPDAIKGFVVSERYSYAISETGYHYGILYKGNVYCNIYPEGLPKNKWINSFYSAGNTKIVTEYSLKGWLRYRARNR